jgi:preprotein translocase subunit SecB
LYRKTGSIMAEQEQAAENQLAISKLYIKDFSFV